MRIGQATFLSSRSIFWVSSFEPEDDVEEGRKAHLHARFSTRRQPEGAEAHTPDNPTLGASSPQRPLPD